MYLIKPIYILQIKLVLESFGLGLDDFQLKDDVKEFISCVKSGFLLEFFNVVIIKYNISVVLDTITLAALSKGKIAAHYVPNIFLQTFCYSIYACCVYIHIQIGSKKNCIICLLPLVHISCAQSQSPGTISMMIV